MPFVARPPISAAAKAALKAMPQESLEDACKGCEAEHEGDVEEYPKGFDVDLDSELLGTMKDYGRQLVISTSKSDWIKEVTDDTASLAGLVWGVFKPKDVGVLEKLASKLKLTESEDEGHKVAEGSPYAGIYPSSAASTSKDPKATPSGKVTIANASFNSSSHSADLHSVLVLPDFKVVHEVEETAEGAEALADLYLRSNVGRAGVAKPRSAMRSWPLPYHAVVLLCSHKKRDRRCHQAAPLLLHEFHTHLELHGFEVDERGDDISDGPPIEEWDEETREAKLEDSLKASVNRNRVGIFKVSHIGGHRYAGNAIIYLPNGTSIWYGRVTPADVAAIVKTTLIGGAVIPELLRGGLGLTREMGKTVLDW